jgi:hypothetical protein
VGRPEGFRGRRIIRCVSLPAQDDEAVEAKLKELKQAQPNEGWNRSFLHRLGLVALKILKPLKDEVEAKNVKNS